jgi:hypothetical protein
MDWINDYLFIPHHLSKLSRHDFLAEIGGTPLQIRIGQARPPRPGYLR